MSGLFKERRLKLALEQPEHLHADAKYGPAHGTSKNGYWNKLGTFDLAPNAGHNVNFSDRTDSVVQADAIRLVSAEGAERIARWEGTVANAGTYQVWVRWPAAPTHTFAASYGIVTPDDCLDY